MCPLSTLSTFCSQNYPTRKFNFPLTENLTSLNTHFQADSTPHGHRFHSVHAPNSCGGKRRKPVEGQKTPSPTRYLAHPMHPKRHFPTLFRVVIACFLRNGHPCIFIVCTIYSHFLTAKLVEIGRNRMPCKVNILIARTIYSPHEEYTFFKYSNKHAQMWTVWTVDSCPHSNSSQKRKLHQGV